MVRDAARAQRRLLCICELEQLQAVVHGKAHGGHRHLGAPRVDQARHRRVFDLRQQLCFTFKANSAGVSHRGRDEFDGDRLLYAVSALRPVNDSHAAFTDAIRQPEMPVYLAGKILRGAHRGGEQSAGRGLISSRQMRA